MQEEKLTLKSNHQSKQSSIETLRALAVILVFAHHLHSGANITLPYIAQIGGWLGVQIFFVISGYLIILSALRYNTKTYVWHRFLRIYPAYFLWFIIFSIIFRHLKWENIDFTSLLIHLIFLQHIFPEAYQKYNSLLVSWTLTIEIAWYVVAWICAIQFKKHPYLVISTSIFLSYGWIFFGWADIFFSKEMIAKDRFFFVNNHFINQLPFFLFGALIAVRNIKFDNSGLLGIFLTTIILSSSWKSHFPDPIFITGFGVVSIFLMLKEANYKNPKFISLLSDISYSFYLIHYPIILIVSRATGNKTTITAASLVLTIFFAYLSYRFIEKPCMNLAKRRSRPASARTAASTSMTP